MMPLRHTGFMKIKIDYNLCPTQGAGNLGNLMTYTMSNKKEEGAYLSVENGVSVCAPSVSSSTSMGLFFGIQNSECAGALPQGP